MARSRPAYSIGSRAVAVAIMAEVVNGLLGDVPPLELEQAVGRGDFEEVSRLMADQLVRVAWDVEYKPNAERLVLVIDAGISDDEPSSQEGHIATYGEVGPDDVVNNG